MVPIVCYSDSDEEEQCGLPLPRIIDGDDIAVRDVLLNIVEAVVSVQPYAGAGDPGYFDSAAYRDNLGEHAFCTSRRRFTSSSSTDGSDSDAIFDDVDKCASTIEPPPDPVPVVPGELSLEIEHLSISVGEEVELLTVGTVESIVDVLVVVKSAPNTLPLNEETLLFAGDRTAVGQIFETFGPVKAPYYSIRFNSVEEIANMGIHVKQTLFYANTSAYSCPVFVNALQEMKGSDASWENDLEPPPEAVDFSDDEEERKHRSRLKAKRKRGPIDKNGKGKAEGKEANYHPGQMDFLCRNGPAAFGGHPHRGYGGFSSNANRPSNIPMVATQPAVPFYPPIPPYVRPRAPPPWHAPTTARPPANPFAPWVRQFNWEQ
uniref:H/ACA ribonucleoprotein complex non-core subunit NAF1 n=1 Tax=Trichuris muris TaxID=70415 RepID=A0A5S6R2Z4_TRIMR